MRKKFLVFALGVIMSAILMPACVFAADDVRVFINDEELIADVPPRIINGRTMLPIRAVSEAVGCSVNWFEPERRVDIYTPYGGDLVMSLYIDKNVIDRYSRDAFGNAIIEKETIEAAPVIINGRTLVPLRLIAEAMRFKVDWNEATKTVYLQSPEIITVEQARDFLYENYVDAELFYPAELDKWQGGVLYYGFTYDDGDAYKYVWVNSVTKEVEFADEVLDYMD